MNEIGIDIVEIERLNSLKEGFINHVLSPEEIKIYKKYEGERSVEFLAGRFAAKEAIIKCLSDIEIPNMNEIEILNKDNGKPSVKYKDYKIKVSISHERHYACAIAILEDNK